MTCGDPHDPDCAEALDHLYEFLDGEIDADEAGRIRAHLDECGPCLQEYDVERIVKAIVARSCCQQAPDVLRARVVAQLVSVRIQLQPPPG